MLGAGLLAVRVALVALALVQGPDWGWLSGRTGGVAGAAVLAAGALAVRSARHAAPVVDPALLRDLALRGASVASLAYYLAFAAFLLNTVTFLTGVWDYSGIRAGLAIAPGPLMVLPFARLVAPRLLAPLGGPARVVALGCALGVVAQLLWWSQVQPAPAYATTLLPAQLLGGAGVGLVIPSLIGAGTATLPAARFGAGSGVLNTARQVGLVLGVAALVAVLSGSVDPVQGTRGGALLSAAGFAVAAGLGVRLAGAAQRSARSSGKSS